MVTLSLLNLCVGKKQSHSSQRLCDRQERSGCFAEKQPSCRKTKLCLTGEMDFLHQDNNCKSAFCLRKVFAIITAKRGQKNYKADPSSAHVPSSFRRGDAPLQLKGLVSVQEWRAGLRVLPSHDAEATSSSKGVSLLAVQYY